MELNFISLIAVFLTSYKGLIICGLVFGISIILLILRKKYLQKIIKTILVILSIISFAFICFSVILAIAFGRTNQRNKTYLLNLNMNEQIIDVPEMTIEYGPGLDVPGLIRLIEWVKSGTSYWHYYNGKQIIAINSDSMHPLDNFENMVKIQGTKKIKIFFPNAPSHYFIRYWNEKYIGDASAYENYFQTMEIKNDTIDLPDLNYGYIFEIKAVWELLNGIKGEGYANYSFFVTSNVLEK
jgi:hypothetical protein